jgi:hypothetical protein
MCLQLKKNFTKDLGLLHVACPELIQPVILIVAIFHVDSNVELSCSYESLYAKFYWYTRASKLGPVDKRYDRCRRQLGLQFRNRQQIAMATSTHVATTSKRRSDDDILPLIRSPYKVMDGDRKTRNLSTTRAAMLRHQSFDWSGGKARLISIASDMWLVVCYQNSEALGGILMKLIFQS